MMTPDEFVTESYRAWIDQVANWTADHTDLLQPWCDTCAGSDFADSVAGLRELPHSAVHALLFGLETGFVRARDRLVNRQRNELISEWRIATDPDLMMEELLAATEGFVLGLWRELLARRESQQRELEHWEGSMRERMHEALHAAAAEQTGLVLELIPRAVELAIDDEIDSTSIRSLAVWGGVGPHDAATMRAEIERVVTEWMLELPVTRWGVVEASVAQPASCELCTHRIAWLGDVDAPHSSTHDLVGALDRVLRSIIDHADWRLREPPFDRLEVIARYERAFGMIMQGRHREIARAIDVYVR
jgi:hypothetical protein